MISRKDKSQIKDAIEKNNAKKVLIQAPEGMKSKVQKIASEIESLGVQVIIFADPCFGACDIPDSFAKEINCDLIIHFGHTSLDLKTIVPVEYIEWRMHGDVVPILEKNISKLEGFENIGLAASVQYIEQLGPAEDLLKSRGKKVFVGKPERAKYPGQVLGCDASAITSIEGRVDCALLISSGIFHAKGIAKATELPVLVADMEEEVLRRMDNEQSLLQKQRILKSEQFKDAKDIGILVSCKKGQMETNPFSIKKKVESMGKRVWIIAMDYISPDKLMGMDFDMLLNTACPRIEEDVVFKQPVVSWQELRKSLE